MVCQSHFDSEDTSKQSSSPSVMVSNLEKYNFQQLIEKMIEKGWSRRTAEAVFPDLILFLSISATHHNMVPPNAVDEMWHEFIVHTEEYHKFCMENFGKFIHHRPGKTAAKVSRRTIDWTLQAARSSSGKELSKNWEY